MRLTQHPQYQRYVWDRQADQRCREALSAWKASGKPLTSPDDASLVVWTFEQAQSFAHQLVLLVREYNRVLWEQFPYCSQCGGKCCERYNISVDETDSLILALLGLSPPTLPEEIEAAEQDCIYRTASGCAWPVEWRPTICWMFYCLGQPPLIGSKIDGRYDDVAMPLYEAIGDELFAPFSALLPDALHWARDSLLMYLSEPEDLTEVLGEALYETFLHPFNEHYRVIVDE